jgi:hypothetical protein
MSTCDELAVKSVLAAGHCQGLGLEFKVLALGGDAGVTDQFRLFL